MSLQRLVIDCSTTNQAIMNTIHNTYINTFWRQLLDQAPTHVARSGIEHVTSCVITGPLHAVLGY